MYTYKGKVSEGKPSDIKYTTIAIHSIKVSLQNISDLFVIIYVNS